MRKAVIDKAGARYLLIAMLTAKLFTTEPRMLALKVETGAWLVVFLAGLVGLVGYAAIYYLLMRFPGLSLAEISLEVLGKPIGMCFCAAYGAFFIYVTSLMLRQFAGGFRIAILPNTPLSALMVLFMTATLFTAYKGLEATARMASYLFPVLILLFAIPLAGSLRHFEAHWLSPWFGLGIGHTFFTALPESSLYFEMVTLGVIGAMLRQKDLNSVGLGAYLAGWITLTATFLVLEGVFPGTALARLAFPMLELTRMLEISEVFQRLESLFVFLWVFVQAFMVVMTMLSAAYFMAGGAELADYRPLLPAVGLLGFAVGMWPENLVQVVWLDSDTLRVWGWSIGFGLPAITLGVAALRGKRGVPGEQSLAARR